jgi:hypothetical protein
LAVKKRQTWAKARDAKPPGFGASRHASGAATRLPGCVQAASPVTIVSLLRDSIIKHFMQQDSEPSRSLRVHALVDGLLAFLSVALVAFGIDALFRAMQ